MGRTAKFATPIITVVHNGPYVQCVHQNCYRDSSISFHEFLFLNRRIAVPLTYNIHYNTDGTGAFY